MNISNKVKNFAKNDLFNQQSDWKDRFSDHDLDLNIENPFKKDDDSLKSHVLVGLITFVVSFGLGVLTGSLISKRAKDPDDILEEIKAIFKEEGPIEGSWIEMTKVPWKKYAYDTDVFYGGISRMEDEELVQYEFIVDAYTGSLMDIYRV